MKTTCDSKDARASLVRVWAWHFGYQIWGFGQGPKSTEALSLVHALPRLFGTLSPAPFTETPKPQTPDMGPPAIGTAGSLSGSKLSLCFVAPLREEKSTGHKGITA